MSLPKRKEFVVRFLWDGNEIDSTPAKPEFWTIVIPDVEMPIGWRHVAVLNSIEAASATLNLFGPEARWAAVPQSLR